MRPPASCTWAGGVCRDCGSLPRVGASVDGGQCGRWHRKWAAAAWVGPLRRRLVEDAQARASGAVAGLAASAEASKRCGGAGYLEHGPGWVSDLYRPGVADWLWGGGEREQDFDHGARERGRVCVWRGTAPAAVASLGHAPLGALEAFWRTQPQRRRPACFRRPLRPQTAAPTPSSRPGLTPIWRRTRPTQRREPRRGHFRRQSPRVAALCDHSPWEHARVSRGSSA